MQPSQVRVQQLALWIWEIVIDAHIHFGLFYEELQKLDPVAGTVPEYVASAVRSPSDWPAVIPEEHKRRLLRILRRWGWATGAGEYPESTQYALTPRGLTAGTGLMGIEEMLDRPFDAIEKAFDPYYYPEYVRDIWKAVYNDRNPERSRQGYVYILRMASGECKIGRTNSITRRILEISPKLPYPVQVVHIIDTVDYVGLERELHDWHSERRLEGEWFLLDQQNLDDARDMFIDPWA